jgi:cell division septation protein DedD
MTNFTILPALFLLASLAAVQSHLTALCVSSGGKGVKPGKGAVWLMSYHGGNSNPRGSMTVKSVDYGDTETFPITAGCNTGLTKGSPADKIRGCANVPNDAIVTCYMNQGPGVGVTNIAYTSDENGDDTKQATIRGPNSYWYSWMSLSIYADVNLRTGTYLVTTTGTDMNFNDYRTYFRLQTEYNGGQIFGIVMKGTVALGDPTSSPTSSPAPTSDATSKPTTATPTAHPTSKPTTATPTNIPTAVPTTVPTAIPTASPTATPTAMPSSVAHIGACDEFAVFGSSTVTFDGEQVQ